MDKNLRDTLKETLEETKTVTPSETPSAPVEETKEELSKGAEETTQAEPSEPVYVSGVDISSLPEAERAIAKKVLEEMSKYAGEFVNEVVIKNA